MRAFTNIDKLIVDDVENCDVSSSSEVDEGFFDRNSTSPDTTVEGFFDKKAPFPLVYRKPRLMI